jgi:hypothetical protein
MSERFELDLENQGNPLVVRLGSWKRLAKHLGGRVTTLIRKMTEAVKRLLKDA